MKEVAQCSQPVRLVTGHSGEWCHIWGSVLASAIDIALSSSCSQVSSSKWKSHLCHHGQTENNHNVPPGVRASSVTVLPCKHKGLSSIPKGQVEKLGMVAHTCQPSLGRWRQVSPGGYLANQLSLLGKFLTSERLCLQRKMGSD